MEEADKPDFKVEAQGKIEGRKTPHTIRPLTGRSLEVYKDQEGLLTLKFVEEE